MMKARRIFCLILALLTVTLLFGGCSARSNGYGSASSSNDMADLPEVYPADDAYEKAESMTGEIDSGTGGTLAAELAADAGRKLIWSGSMELETLEYDNSEHALFALVSDCGGYIQSSQRSGGNVGYSGTRQLRSGYFTVRVPADKFQNFMEAGGEVATVLSTSTSSDDVTDSYFDTEARLEVLRVKESRLLAMLEKGDELEYLIQIENELANTRYEIESLTGTLRRYDGLINYATVDVTLQEVTKPTEIIEPEPQNAWERIAARFLASVRNVWEGVVEVFIFIVGYSPVIIIAAAAVTVIVIAVRIPVRRRKRRNSAKLSTPEDASAEQDNKPEA